MLKCSMPYMTDIYTKLCNTILNSSKYPKAWKTGIMSNLYKSGDRYKPDNYRGLTINSTLSKVFNSILNQRLTSFLENNKISNNKQIGFKKKARTADHIFVLNTLMNKYSRGKSQLFLCFVDFRKAFDSVWHLALKCKLLESGCKGLFYKIIEDMYNNTSSHIKITTGLLPPISCNSGVKQGDVLSPNLFNLFINDLPDCIGVDNHTPILNNIPINCLLYADDLVLCSLNATGLQKQLHKLEEYCIQWGLEVNIKKTKILYFGRKDTNYPKIYYLKQNLEFSDCYKYLGILIHNKKANTEIVKNLCTRSWKAVFKLNSLTSGIDVSPISKLRLFDKVVLPILTYNSVNWGIILSKCLNPRSANNKDMGQEYFWEKVLKLPHELLHAKFCKGILGVHRKTTNVAVLGELGRLPISLHVIRDMIKYWVHIKDTNFVNDILGAASTSKYAYLNGTFFDCLKKIYSLFNWAWTDSPPSMREIKLMVNDMKISFAQYWNKKIKTFSKTELLSNLAKTFGTEKYVTDLKSNIIRSSFAKFRTSSHKLEIETGRHIIIKIPGQRPIPMPRELRFCTLCEETGIKILGDEIHMLLNCSSLEKERLSLFTHITNEFIPSFASMDDTEKVRNLLTCVGKMLNAVSVFIHKGLSLKRKPLCPPSPADLNMSTEHSDGHV